jgi:hypothetical protein
VKLHEHITLTVTQLVVAKSVDSSYTIVMNTIVLTMEEATQDLATLIRGMHERRECVVVKDSEGPLAYLTLAFRPDPEEAGDRTCPQGTPQEYSGPRVSYSKRTGLPVVNPRPGQRMVTSEEIYEELRGTFP